MPYGKSNKEIQEAHMGGVGKSPTTYAPFKMKGHELPGPNQRTPAVLKAFGTKDSDMPDKVSQESGLLYTEGGVGSSPAKSWFSDIAKKVGGGIKKAVGMTPIGMGAKALFGNKGGGGGGGGGGVAPHGDEAHTGGGGEDAGAITAGGGEEALDPQLTKKQQVMATIKEKGARGLFGGGQGGGGGKFGRMGV